MSTFYRSARAFVVRPLARAFFNPWVKGLGHVPETGGAILASNHLSAADHIFMPIAVQRQIFFLAKSDYFTGRTLKGRAIAAFFRAHADSLHFSTILSASTRFRTTPLPAPRGSLDTVSGVSVKCL